MDWDTDDDDDDAILLDSALNSVCHEDLRYLMAEFGVDLPPVKPERQPSSKKRFKRYVETRQDSENAIDTIKDLQRIQFDTDEGKIPEVDGLSESSEDEQQENVSSSDDQSEFKQFRCANCNSPKKYTKIYGMDMCSACQKFIFIMPKQEFRTICIGGQGTCRTTYSNGFPVRCQSCRLKNMLKLDIRHPAWLRYKANHGIVKDISGDLEPQDDELYSDDNDDDDNEDRMSMTSGNHGYGQYSSSESDIHEQEESTALSNDGQSRQVKCAGCDAPNPLSYLGINLCIACRKFIRRVAEKGFEVDCIVGLGNCRTTYKAGARIRCRSCRLKKMMKLDIQHPAWVKYKKANGHNISSNFTRPDSADQSEEPHNSDEDDKSTTSSCSNLDVEKYITSESSIDGQDRDILSSERSERSECVGCRAPSRTRRYGMNFCHACKKFIWNIARKKFKVDCIGGQGDCRTTYRPGDIIRCHSCRLKKLMKIDIRHPEWVKYKAQHSLENETLHGLAPHGEESYLDDVGYRDSVASSYESTNDRQHTSTKARVEERKKTIAPLIVSQTKCLGCNAPTSLRAYGLRLCKTCRRYIGYVAEENKFHLRYRCEEQGNCRTTYLAGHRMKCASCRIEKLMKLDVRHPVWVRYKAKHEIERETFDDPAPSGDEIHSEADDDDEERQSILSSSDIHSSAESSIDDREDIIPSTHHGRGRGQLEGSKCAGCDCLIHLRQFHGAILCDACRSFISYTMKDRKLSVSCVAGRGNCRTTYIAGKPIICAFCRIKKLMKLDIQDSKWVEFKAKQEIKLETFDDPASGDEIYSNDDDDDDEDSSDKSSDRRFGSSRSNAGGRHSIETSTDNGQSRRELPKCAGCENSNSIKKIYGLLLCCACRIFIYTTAKLDRFNVSCLEGHGNCRTTYIADQPIMCRSCRIKKFMKLDIQHPVWVKFKAENATRGESSHNPASRRISRVVSSCSSSDDDDDDDDDHEDRDSSDNSQDKRHSSPRSGTDGRKSGTTSPDHGEGECERLKCAGCDNSRVRTKMSGMYFCSHCTRFISDVARMKFEVSCTAGSGNCRTTYKAGDKIRCHACWLKRMMQLDIRHPAWVKYKEGHTTESETADNFAPQGNELDSDDDQKDMMGITSNHNNQLTEATLQLAPKSLIEPGEDCDADDEIEVIEIDCDQRAFRIQTRTLDH